MLSLLCPCKLIEGMRQSEYWRDIMHNRTLIKNNNGRDWLKRRKKLKEWNTDEQIECDREIKRTTKRRDRFNQKYNFRTILNSNDVN